MYEQRKLSENGQEFFPITHENCVIDENGNSLGEKVKTIKTDLDSKSNTNHNHDTTYLLKNEAASTAKKLTTAVQINNIPFDGSQNINIQASDIPQNSNNRFITDTERNNWNNAFLESGSVYENVESSYISLSGTRNSHLKNVEIKGNTVQNQTNLADIKSVGKKLDNQELYEIPLLSVGKNIFDGELEYGYINEINGSNMGEGNTSLVRSKNYIRIPKYKSCTFSKDGITTALNWFAYDYNKNFIRKGSGRIQLASNECYIRFYLGGLINDKYQIEEGTTATQYEPYKSNELTILSPCQLEKVGDIADRIIEKNGVLGVEKNVETITDFSNLRAYLHQEVYTNTYRVECYLDGKIGSYLNDSTDIISNKLPSINNYNVDKVGIFIAMGKDKFYTRLSKNDITVTPTNEVCLKYLKDNLTMIKLKSANPQFIPLPHDQQILLKTFDNKTNISFLTEIEGTIKAQVPKSIKATVNTHTSQIENIYDELDRVKKLEESTVSTVSTEKDFANVQATTNGYFEDIKLSGKTLVNKNLGKLNKYYSNGNVLIDDANTTSYYMECEIGKEYTVIKSPSNRFLLGECDNISANSSVNPIFSIIDSTETIIKKIKATKKYLFLYVSNSNTEVDVLFLEGNHTQNPPSYFEGLKSVGDGVDEIVVSSDNGELNNVDNEFATINVDNGKVEGKGSRKNIISGYNLVPNHSPYIRLVDKDLNVLSGTSNFNNVTLRFYDSKFNYKGDVATSDSFYVRYRCLTTNNYEMSGNSTDYLFINTKEGFNEYKADKKRILYLDPTDNTWKKPVLREWDTIEKHADGKYYYHQRSPQITFNGKEDWFLRNDIGNTTHAYFQTTGLIKHDNKGICNKFNVVSEAYKDKTWLRISTYNKDCLLGINIPKNELNLSQGDDENTIIQKFKTLLPTLGINLVYKSLDEKVYECTNIDLITYANETNYVFSGGVISPKTSLKVQNNISNVVSTLQKKVSVLESYISMLFKAVLAGDMRSIAQTFYPEDFYAINKDNIYNNNETEVIEK